MGTPLRKFCIPKGILGEEQNYSANVLTLMFYAPCI